MKIAKLISKAIRAIALISMGVGITLIIECLYADCAIAILALSVVIFILMHILDRQIRKSEEYDEENYN